MASIALTVAGNAIAPGIGGLVGGYIGSQIDSYLLSPGLPDQIGPRLDSLLVQSSANGAPIKRVYSTARIAGNVIWARPINETRHKQGGGKGGPSTPDTITYTYTADFAVALCAGEILGVSRIWADAKLIYDVSANASIKSVFASGELADNIRVYTGSETQEPDPFIQANESNTPAYRGLAYVMFEGFPLGAHGNRIPNISCEVVSGGTLDPRGVLWTDSTNITTFTQAEGSEVKAIAYSEGALELVVAENRGEPYYVYRYDVDGNLLQKRLRGGAEYIGFDSFIDYSAITLGGNSLSTKMVKPGLYEGDLTVEQGLFSYKLAERYSTGTVYATHENGELGGFAMTPDGRRGYVFLEYPTGSKYQVWDFADQLGISQIPSYVGEYDTGGPAQSLALGWPGYKPRVAVENDQKHAWIINHNLSPSRYRIEDDGTWTLVFNSTSNWGIADYWTAVAVNGVLFAVRESGALYAIADTSVITSTDETLQSVVTDICTRNNRISASDIDVSALSGSVRGMIIESLKSPRQELEPLGTAFGFDAVESDWKLKFVPRGTSSVKTIPYDDLATHLSGSARPSNLEQNRLQESELPQQIAVKALNADIDYQQSEQTSIRQVTESVSVKSVSLPIVLNDDELAQLSDTLLWSTWAHQTDLAFTLPIDYIGLDPGDVVVVETLTANHLVQMQDVEAGDGIISVKARSEELAAYTSTRSGATTTIPAQSVGFGKLTDYAMIDGPFLKYGANSPGFYFAAKSDGAAWTGATLYYSDDDGYSYERMGGVNEHAIIGQANTVLADASPFVVDGGSINVSSNSALYSVSETQFYAGSNLAAIGADGRWEVVSFQNAVLESDDTYTISTFLRGLGGTEHAMSKHSSGDQFVMLNELGGVTSIHANENSIEQQRYYKVVSDGSTLDAAPPISFTLSSNRQKPLSPVHIEVRKQASGDFVIDCIRRARSGGEWRDAVDVALDETSESYEIDVTSDTDATATKSATALPYTYTVADQITDLGAETDYLGVEIYQLSSVVGRGYPGIYLFDGFSYLTNFIIDKYNCTVTVDEPNHEVDLTHTDSFQRDHEGINFIGQRKTIRDNKIHIEFYRTQTGSWNSDTGTGTAQFCIQLFFDMDSADVTAATAGANNKHQMYGTWGGNVDKAMIRLEMRKDESAALVTRYKLAGISDQFGTSVTNTVVNARTSGAFDGTELVEIDLYQENGEIVIAMKEGGVTKVTGSVPMILIEYTDYLVALHHHNHYASSTETITEMRIQ